jgi:hypothetical protein
MSKLLNKIEFNEYLNGPNVTLINDKEKDEIINIISKKYDLDRNSIWWWESLVNTNSIINENLKILRIPISFIGLEEFYLMLTDDEPCEEWVCLSVRSETMKKIILNLPLMEFFIVKKDYTVIVFYNHHNEIIWAWIDQDIISSSDFVSI